jgi:hypothetical protein
VRNEIDNIKHSKRRDIARLMGYIVVLSFIAGIIVDLDHPLAVFLGVPYGRFLHPYFAISGAIFISIGIILVISCLCRYIWIRLLKNRVS